MPIQVNVPGALQAFAGGSRRLQVDVRCRTVRDTLRAVAGVHPGVVERVLTETGELREHVNVFVGEENCRFAGGLDAPVRDGAVLEIVASVSGG
ncbi:MAG TPA: MoaD/ThiS family protein [Gemmatimonadaceae bacterium]|nr:MoaD/ThiS family protein [Gemmatimonadaceae bacterium]